MLLPTAPASSATAVPPPVRSRLTLATLPVGEGATIRAVCGPHDDALLRLREMGLTPTTVVTVTRRGLGGDPLELEVRGTRLCLRRRHAACFELDAIAPTAAEPPSR